MKTCKIIDFLHTCQEVLTHSHKHTFTHTYTKRKKKQGHSSPSEKSCANTSQNDTSSASRASMPCDEFRIHLCKPSSSKHSSDSAPSNARHAPTRDGSRSQDTNSKAHEACGSGSAATCEGLLSDHLCYLSAGSADMRRTSSCDASHVTSNDTWRSAGTGALEFRRTASAGSVDFDRTSSAGSVVEFSRASSAGAASNKKIVVFGG
jgi:hypothetical protein